MALEDRIARRTQARTSGSTERIGVRADPNAEIRSRVQEKLMRDLDIAPDEQISDARRQEILQKIDEVMHAEAIPSHLRTAVRNGIFNEIVGLGPIQPLIDDPEISEIMVNGPNQVFVECYGRIEIAEGIRFRSVDHLTGIIERIVAPLGRHVDDTSPLVDARLPDGSRVNVIVPPLALDGPCLTIRKFAKDPYRIGDLLSLGTLNEKMAMFLRATVEARLNIVVAGGTGSGKTTLLNALSSFIPETERIVTIEDAAELHLQQAHVVRLETRPANLEGKGEIPMRVLLRNALRMRPDRIIVGEVRGGEALDMLQAMNTGHDGSLTTLHANSPRDALSRIETMVLMAQMELPLQAIRHQVAAAVHVIVQQSRLQDGTRRVTAISEVVGAEGDVIALQDIFRFDQIGVGADRKVIGSFRATGIRPKCHDLIQSRGVDLPIDVFS